MVKSVYFIQFEMSSGLQVTFPKNIGLNMGQFMKKYGANIGIKKEIIGGYIGPGGYSH